MLIILEQMETRNVEQIQMFHGNGKNLDFQRNKITCMKNLQCISKKPKNINFFGIKEYKSITH